MGTNHGVVEFERFPRFSTPAGTGGEDEEKSEEGCASSG
jgi:hypothetical protein